MINFDHLPWGLTALRIIRIWMNHINWRFTDIDELFFEKRRYYWGALLFETVLLNKLLRFFLGEFSRRLYEITIIFLLHIILSYIKRFLVLLEWVFIWKLLFIWLLLTYHLQWISFRNEYYMIYILFSFADNLYFWK